MYIPMLVKKYILPVSPSDESMNQVIRREMNQGAISYMCVTTYRMLNTLYRMRYPEYINIPTINDMLNLEHVNTSTNEMLNRGHIN